MTPERLEEIRKANGIGLFPARRGWKLDTSDEDEDVVFINKDGRRAYSEQEVTSIELSKDVRELLSEIERLQSELTEAEELIRKHQTAIEEFRSVVNESTGVAGYHLNGEVATWDELGLSLTHDEFRNLLPTPTQTEVHNA